MSKSYFDGKVKLKEPTFKDMLKIGELLDEHEVAEMIGGEYVEDLIKTICIIEEGFDISKLTAIQVTQIAMDYFKESIKEYEEEIVNA